MRPSNRHGFTLVELNLAIIFVAILVIGIAAVVMNVTKINQRGITLKTINQTGREVTDMMRRDIAASRASSIQYQTAAGVGRLCLGTVSYVFNTAATLRGSNPLRDQSGRPVTLVRMDDRDRQWCQRSGEAFVKTGVTAADNAVELLQTDQLPVAVHSMEVVSVASTRTGGLIRFTLALGTNEAGTIQDGAATCKPPTDREANFDNCAVREFSTVVRSNGED